MPKLFSSILFVLFALQPVLSFGKVIEHDSYCLDAESASLRQTTILVDGSTMSLESNGALGSTYWRSQIRRFIDASADEAGVYMAPGERVSIGMIMPNGSGVNVTFSGCMPILPKSVIAENEQQETKLSWFLGGGWEREYEEGQKEFLEAAVKSLALLMKDNGPVDVAEKITFVDSKAAASLANYRGINRHQGVPRVIIVTDLSLYEFPTGDADAVSSTAKSDALVNGTDLGYSEVHLLTEKSPSSNHVKQYLEAYFLQAKSTLSTFVAGTGALNTPEPPVQVRQFVGEVVFEAENDAAKLPMMFRLALDKNGRLINSWMKETQGKDRYLPVYGDLQCPGNGRLCTYYGDNVFAQIWNKHKNVSIADGDAGCPNDNGRLPFMGFRNLNFSIDEERLEGIISDKTCFNAGDNDGVIRFNLTEVEHGQL